MSDLACGTKDMASADDSAGMMQLSRREYEQLVQAAVKHNYRPYENPGPGERFVKTSKEVVAVPVEKTVKVPVKKEVATTQMRKQKVMGTKVVPVEKKKIFEEKIIEVEEVKMKGVRKEWQLVEVPYEYIVKKPVERIRKKEVPYTEYEIQNVEIEVEVPCDEKKTLKGYRYDKQLGTKYVEVEREQVYEMRPHLVQEGAIRKNNEKEVMHGLTKLGKEVYRPGTAGTRPGSAGSRPSSAGSVMSNGSRASNASRRSNMSRASSANAYGRPPMGSLGPGREFLHSVKMSPLSNVYASPSASRGVYSSTTPGPNAANAKYVGDGARRVGPRGYEVVSWRK